MHSFFPGENRENSLLKVTKFIHKQELMAFHWIPSFFPTLPLCRNEILADE